MSNMKKINFLKWYLALAIIVLVIIWSIASYFIVREVISKKYISNDLYLSMFYNDFYSDECKYINWDYREKVTDEDKIKKCIKEKQQVFLEKREFKYKFNLIKYGVLLWIVLVLLWVHSFLYVVNRKK